MSVLPEQLANVPLWQWQLNGVTLIVVLQLLKSAWEYWKTNGGARGIWRAFVGPKNEKPTSSGG